jgi:hypothetical protein
MAARGLRSPLTVEILLASVLVPCAAMRRCAKSPVAAPCSSTALAISICSRSPIEARIARIERSWSRLDAAGLPGDLIGAGGLVGDDFTSWATAKPPPLAGAAAPIVALSASGVAASP